MTDINRLVHAEDVAYAVRDQPRGDDHDRVAAVVVIASAVVALYVGLGLGPLGIPVALLSIGWLFLLYMVVRVLTEILRTLRRLSARLAPDDGQPAASTSTMVCSLCDQSLDGGPTCPGCGRTIIVHGAATDPAVPKAAPPDAPPPDTSPESGSDSADEGPAPGST